jgi:hypothetical protein
MSGATTFTNAQAALAAARADRRAAQTAAWQAAQRLQAAKRSRAADEQAITAVSEQASRARQAARAAAAAESAALSAFAEIADPRRAVSELSDRLPFVLMPVRLETRFMRASGDSERAQLWVRIYPDDCWIDSFEPMLSDTELANAKVYWQNIWRAGGIEADQRAAWRNLVAAHGSGRAGYIVDPYQSVNVGAPPVKARVSDEVLVIATQTPPATADADALAAYWQAVWLADGNAPALQAGAGCAHCCCGRRERHGAGRRLPAVQPIRRAHTAAEEGRCRAQHRVPRPAARSADEDGKLDASAAGRLVPRAVCGPGLQRECGDAAGDRRPG